ncbi:MAG: hypothetical protein GAK35_00788 [Herbaspirillum frisingense]|uniref:Uncharacterized protein n=1 Tax=Herbaspirillum frisingense TaxID=92645 RepID=A0A7V8FZB6_9BURK|nr:MAG: hypothetical protein GAK35_00788 [Herbaspirillum frisingense]
MRLIGWLGRRSELLRQQKDEVWGKLMSAAPSEAGHVTIDSLFSQSLEAEIEFCRVTRLKAHLEDGGKPLPYDEAHISGLFASVHKEEDALIARFENWKENKAGPLQACVDFAPWRAAMEAYFHASPGEV